MTHETTINTLFLKSLLLAEITRLKFGSGGMSLTNPTIERNARHQFAALTGIKPTSKPNVFLSTIKQVYADNKMATDFESTLTRFKLNALDF